MGVNFGVDLTEATIGELADVDRALVWGTKTSEAWRTSDASRERDQRDGQVFRESEQHVQKRRDPQDRLSGRKLVGVPPITVRSVARAEKK